MLSSSLSGRRRTSADFSARDLVPKGRIIQKNERGVLFSRLNLSLPCLVSCLLRGPVAPHTGVRLFSFHFVKRYILQPLASEHVRPVASPSPAQHDGASLLPGFAVQRPAG